MMEHTFTLNKNEQKEKLKTITTWDGYASVKITSRIKRVIGLTQSKGKLIKENAKTVIIRLPDGNIIKRHKVKHEVK